MKKLAVFAAVAAIAGLSTGAWADTLTGYHGFYINVANNTNTFYMDFPSPTSGMNAEWIGSSTVTDNSHYTSITTANPSPTGSFTLKDTGGSGGGVTDFILLMSVAGPIASNFSVNLQWGSNNQTFTSSNFTYDPRTTRPGPNASMSLYPGQDINDPATAAYLMFVDMQAGPPSVPVAYSFTGLYNNVVAFNMYGYSPTGGNIHPGFPGIDWTNKTLNGYVIYDTAAPVPIPPSVLLLAGGFGSLGLLRRRSLKDWFKKA